jgi:hypothetical protein
LRDLIQSKDYRGFARCLERDAQIAVAGKIRIERNSPEAGDAQA